VSRKTNVNIAPNSFVATRPSPKENTGEFTAL